MKVSYVIDPDGVRIIGQLFISPYPIETLDARVIPAVEEDLSTKTEVIQTVRAAAAKYVNTSIDVKSLLEEDPE